jgi:hypothetical protein
MPLILAIDSDRRQSEQLAALMRSRLKVELVQATSAGEGLHALHDRVPDLILTSPLLSPFDDGVLDEYLRELGTQAAHVQTVRIPVLSAVSKPSARSLFTLRRKKTPSTTPDGCDPKMFADEIAQYLARAQERRAAKTAPPAPVANADAAPSAAIESMSFEPIETMAQDEDPIVRDFAPMPSDDEDNDAVYQPAPTIQTFEIPEEPEPIALSQPEPPAPPADHEPLVVRPMSILNLTEPMVIERRQPVLNDPAPIAPMASHAMVSEPDAIVPEPSRAIFFNEPIQAALPPEPIEVVEAPEPILVSQPVEAVSHADLSDAPVVVPAPMPSAVETTIETRATQPRPATAPITSFETALAAIRAAWGPTGPNTSSAHAHRVGRNTGTDSVARDLKQAPAVVHPADVQSAATTSPVRPAQVEVDLTGDIDALEEIDRSRTAADEPSSADESSARRPSPKARNTAPLAPKARATDGGPVQDEWGIFDPNQCGFSALVDKLDEVADPHDHPGPTRVRVISVG